MTPDGSRCGAKRASTCFIGYCMRTSSQVRIGCGSELTNCRQINCSNESLRPAPLELTAVFEFAHQCSSAAIIDILNAPAGRTFDEHEGDGLLLAEIFEGHR